MPDTSDSPPRKASSRTARLLGFLRRNWSWALVVVAALYLWQTIHPDVDLPASGPPAPEVVLPTMSGDVFRLSDHRGEVVVLNVWATWCPPCRMEIPGFVDLQEEFRERGVLFVGLSVDDEGFEVVRPYAEEHAINYPQLASQRVAYRDYGTGTSVPRTYVIDKWGRIRYEHTGLLLKGALAPVLDELAGETAPEAGR